MKKLIIGCTVVVVLLVIGAAIGPELVFSASKSNLEGECKEFVDSAIVAIALNWDSRELIRRVDPEMLRPGDDKKMENLFRLYRKLGGLVEYYGCEGQVYRDSSVPGAEGFAYVAEADFENGSATVKVEGIHQDGNSYILDFSINSGAFVSELIDQ